MIHDEEFSFNLVLALCAQSALLNFVGAPELYLVTCCVMLFRSSNLLLKIMAVSSGI